MPPFGHATQLRVFIDPDLLQNDQVWAAAGTWHDEFGIEPHKLVEASGGAVTDLKRGRPTPGHCLVHRADGGLLVTSGQLEVHEPAVASDALRDLSLGAPSRRSDQCCGRFGS